MMEDSKRHPPILVTGCPRSGTTWVGDTLSASKEVFHIYEPFNNDAPHHLRIPNRFINLSTYSDASLQQELEMVISLGRPRDRTAMALRGIREARASPASLGPRLAARALISGDRSFWTARRVCIKDPLAFFSAEHIFNCHNAEVVIVVRNPFGVISSYIALGWGSEMPALVSTTLTESGLTSNDIVSYLKGECSLVDELILQWKIFAIETIAASKRHPEWHFLIHDDLCHEPEARFQALFDRLGLPFSPRVKKKIAASTSSANPTDAYYHKQHMLRRDSKGLIDIWKERIDEELARKIEICTSDLWHELKNATSN